MIQLPLEQRHQLKLKVTRRRLTLLLFLDARLLFARFARVGAFLLFRHALP